MKLFRFLTLRLTLLLLLVTASLANAETDAGQISISVGRLMEQGHYSRHKLDDEISARLLQNYLEALDYSHLFFTQQDVAGFEGKLKTGLDDDILLGNPEPAVQIYSVYKKRVEERVAKIKKWIAEDKFDFKSDRTVVLNRQKVPWPKDDAEADQLWHDRIEGELLQEKLGVHAIGSSEKTPKTKNTQEKTAPVDSPAKIVSHRYEQVLRNLHEQTDKDAIDIFLSALAQTYDPHSEYMSKTELDNFSINMKLSLVGIGAVLRSDDGYAKIMELVTGGPAHKEGHLKVGDRIAAVAQGDSQFTDVFDMKLDKVVTLIRGKKGTKVRLQVIPSRAADPSSRKVIEIVREKVELKDQEAKGQIIEKPDGKGNSRRLGWITLPSFYGDMDNPGAKSPTRDVLALLNRMKKENISGLVIDLRRNGGGSLDEAIKLTGLFIKNSRPAVVQVKNANGETKVLRDEDTDMAYDGPLIVLINTLSASASEIFAGALQDYGRAVIVGDQHTFGKGTVQTMLSIGKFIPFLGGNEDEAGALKLTIQKFYRVAGGSTQFKGVASDVVLPSLWDHDDIGEAALKGPLPYDEVAPADYAKVSNHPLFIDQLRALSAARIAVEPEFKYVTEDLAKLKEKIAENRVSLNEQVRRAEIAKEKALKDARIAERTKRHVPELTAYSLTLDNVTKPQLELAKNDLSNAGSDKSFDAPKAEPKNAKGKKFAAIKEKKKGDQKQEAIKDASDPDDEDDIDGFDAEKNPKIDPIRNEALNILSDLIDLSKSQKTASTSAAQ